MSLSDQKTYIINHKQIGNIFGDCRKSNDNYDVSNRLLRATPKNLYINHNVFLKH